MKMTDETRQKLLDCVVEDFKKIARADIFDNEKISGVHPDFTEEAAQAFLGNPEDLEKTREGFWEDMNYFINRE